MERDHALAVVLPGGLEKNATVHGRWVAFHGFSNIYIIFFFSLRVDCQYLFLSSHQKIYFLINLQFHAQRTLMDFTAQGHFIAFFFLPLLLLANQ